MTPPAPTAITDVLRRFKVHSPATVAAAIRPLVESEITAAGERVAAEIEALPVGFSAFEMQRLAAAAARRSYRSGSRP